MGGSASIFRATLRNIPEDNNFKSQWVNTFTERLAVLTGLNWLCMRPVARRCCCCCDGKQTSQKAERCVVMTSPMLHFHLSPSTSSVNNFYVRAIARMHA
jgi:hypothetical protein